VSLLLTVMQRLEQSANRFGPHTNRIRLTKTRSVSQVGLAGQSIRDHFERRADMPNLTPEQQAQIPILLPNLVNWSERMEAKALAEGAPLSNILRDTAKTLGIKDFDAVRIFAVESIPAPEDERIVKLASELGLSFAAADGMAFGHGIFVRHSEAQNNELLTHELVHVRQYEQARSVAAYLSTYVQQILRFGYQNMPLEREAVTETEKLWGFRGTSSVLD
jgi:hypothetical protein